MRIALLGWGSLIWDPQTLRVAGEWTLDGPILPIEFSRVSDNGRLTLVIDEENGVPAVTRTAISALNDLELAIVNLQNRERMPNKSRIGFIDKIDGNRSQRASKSHGTTCDRIQAWANDRQVDAVLWTALGPRFLEKTGETFSPEAAVRYLGTLDGQIRQDAFSYIRRAPPEICTPVRERFQQQFPN